jgi:uncharacterized protein (TIGR02284 family)
MKPSEIVHTLQDLVEVSKDGQYSFEFCASHAEADSLKQFFEKCAGELDAEAREFQSLVAEYGGKPVQHGTASGAVHRGWIRVKDTLGGTNDPDLLEECAHGEQLTLKRLRTAADEEQLPDSIRSTAAAHADNARRCIEQLQRLRSEMRAAA